MAETHEARIHRLAKHKKLEAVYDVLVETLRIAKMGCPDELRLDIEATEQAMYDVGLIMLEETIMEGR